MTGASPPPGARFWNIVFQGKGLWNCGFSVVLFFVDDELRERLGAEPADFAYRAMFLALAFVFGLGYWRVGQDLTSNRDIVRGCVLGQTSVFLVVGYEVFVARRLPVLYLLPGTVDLVFAVLFTVFLLKTRVPDTGASRSPTAE
jgi:hypothetical protein